MSGEAGVLRTPDEWCDLLGARVMDPDGWRDGSREWWEPISREEFDSRLRVCTIDSRGYPTFAAPPLETLHRALKDMPTCSICGSRSWIVRPDKPLECLGCGPTVAATTPDDAASEESADG